MASHIYHTQSSSASTDHSMNNNPYVQYSPAPMSSSPGPRVSVMGCLTRCGQRVEDAARQAGAIADDVWHHFKISPSFTDAAMARLTQGTKVLTEGGYDKVFRQIFETSPGEKLLHSYACYLSTSTGPVIGTLYISNKRIAFCSDVPLSHYSSYGNQEWIYYKVVIQNDQLRNVNPATNRWNPTEKYIHVVTRDGHEFWFMGFISFDKALKNLYETLPIELHHHSSPQSLI